MQAAPPVSDEHTIPRLVQAVAKRFADKNAIEDGPRQLTYAELAAECLRATRACCAMGIRPGDRVAIWAPNISEWVIAAIGLQSVGGVLVPLNTRLKGAEAGYVLRKSGARLLFTVSEFLNTDYVDLLREEELPALQKIVLLQGERETTLSWEAFLQRGEATSEEEARARAAAVSPDDLSDLLFTSGTTGNPKGVMTSHGQNVLAFTAWSEVVGLREEDRYLVVNPFFHAFGYKAGWLASLMRGTTILPHAIFDVPAVLDRVAKERVSVLPGAPTLYQSILAHPDRTKYDLSSLRLAVTGAAVIPVELIHRMRDELGFETIITGYGLTECCGIVTMCRYDDDPETIAMTSGRAIPGVEVRCVDLSGVDVPVDEPGEVVVRGFNVMQGYFDDEEATANTIDADGWLHTGDVAVMNDRGYLRITDRIKDMYIVGGFNCYPAEIENLMYGSGKVSQVAVVGIPDERMGEVGMAYVVPTLEAELTPESVIAWCRDNMANYKVPRVVEIVDSLPTNAAGKVMKFVLREQARVRHGWSR